MKALVLVVVVLIGLTSPSVEAAKRLGGGKSMGSQSANVAQREALPPATVPPPRNAPAPDAVRQNPGPAPATPRPWGGMLGGLAAGLGLAWLAHSMGFGEAFGQFMLFGLLVLVLFAAVGLVLKSRRPSARPERSLVADATSSRWSAGVEGYSLDHVGNDASARPWERNSMSFELSRQPAEVGRFQAGSGIAVDAGPVSGRSWGIPAGFDVVGFLATAKRNFVTLQDAWDRSDMAVLRSMMTDVMVLEIQSQLAERAAHTGGQINKTDVVLLEAQLLGIEDLGAAYMASVEYSGMIREDPSAGPGPFREVWNMSKPKNGSSGWLVAGVQALQ